MTIEQKIDKCILHDDKNIRGFFKDFRWLSNFHLCDVHYQGDQYISSENAYQAAKIEKEYRQELFKCAPSEAKKIWHNYEKIDAKPIMWDIRKYQVMTVILIDKFNRNVDLKQKLIDTGDKYLEETNWWGDQFWGVLYDGSGGANKLGEILMYIRGNCLRKDV